ncbi:MAG: YigZ family protein [Clostridia bacterium]|nr:YigZ family protein [Clostridia bacterium]
MFRTVEGSAEATYEIKKSVFIARIKGVNGVDEGVAFVKDVKSRHTDARHNCYAVLCCDGQKFSDDGEPSGTAGQPILQAIKNSGLCDVALVVTRYFGGIKLGANGLVTSYQRAASEAIEKATTVVVKASDVGEISCDYTDYRKTNELLERFGKVLSTDYGDGITIRYAVPVEERGKLDELLAESTAGRVKATYSGVENIKYNE